MEPPETILLSTPPVEHFENSGPCSKNRVMTHRQRIILWTWASGLRLLPLLAHCQKNWLSGLRRDAG
jgi:hypothetical protein